MMQSRTTRDFFVELLSEAMRGSMLGMRIGDHADVLRARHGEPDNWNDRRDLLRYGPVEFTLDPEGIIQIIYVELPYEMGLTIDMLPEVPPPAPTSDPENWIANAGPARIHVDPRTGRVRAFAL